MTVDKSLLAGSTTMLVLKLLDGQDMYGYQMIEELSRRSERAFALKTGTLYPLLHSLEEKELIRSYEKDEGAARPRRYYHLARKGHTSAARKRSRMGDIYHCGRSRAERGRLPWLCLKPFTQFARTAAEQLRWKKARPLVEDELLTHLCDQRDALMAGGMDETVSRPRNPFV